ncbi:MAG: FtsX-like permease family protein [Dehalococcoidia bacterium]
MRNMHRKLIRDLLSSKGLFISVTVIVLLAVAFFGSMYMAYKNLDSSYNYSYERLNFADFTVKVSQDASEVEDKLESISGVNEVTSRMKAEFALTLPGSKEKRVLATVISLPGSADARAGMVNNVHVDEGSYFSENNSKSFLLERNFAEHHDLSPGQNIWMNIRGNKTEFIVAGIVESPEYIFPAKSRQEVMISPEIWGVVFVPDTLANSLFGEPDNEFCFLVNEGADLENVISMVKTVLEPYQIMELIRQEDQPSNAGLQMDLEQFSTLSNIFPILFIIVGAMATYILLTRIIYNQRSQIGLMRALGYSRLRVMTHYLSFALAIGLVGSVLGVIAGYFLSEALTRYYAQLINLPFTTTQVRWFAMGEGFLLGLLPCLISGFIPAWSASRIRPAEAMRPQPPVAGRKLLLETIFPFLKRLSSLWKIPLRNIFRNRRRSLYTVIGVTFGVSLILISSAMIDSVYALIDFMFDDVTHYDAKIDLTEPQSSRLLDQVSGWEDVEEVEPFLKIPARLEYAGNDYSTMAVALPSDSSLRRLYSPSGDRVSTSAKGILLSEALEGVLDVGKGDNLQVQTILGTVDMEVIGFVKEPMGSFGYVDLKQGQSLAGGDDIVSGMYVKSSPGYSESIRDKAYALESSASVELVSETRDRIDEMMRSATSMLWIMLLFGACLAMAIVFTTVTVNILERRREIATMRTLGKSRTRINLMITIENMMLGLCGLVPGIFAGYALALYFFSLFQGDMFTFDLIVLPRTYVLTTVIIVIVILVSQIPSLRSLNRLDLATVTKEQAS